MIANVQIYQNFQKLYEIEIMLVLGERVVLTGMSHLDPPMIEVEFGYIVGIFSCLLQLTPGLRCHFKMLLSKSIFFDGPEDYSFQFIMRFHQQEWINYPFFLVNLLKTA